ncbi:DUF4411 family protein [Actinomyces bowdenii]|uniref:DUF4411 family protein n=1 Tax=Actinomyces bowdenii TaxID=131109 RepID=UPI001ABCE01C|nr:DUF4411 family protein [Actinomyces bowdenii]MBO3725700.1 DUF4411 family protein [Actinomyces bowdenii]
MTCLLDANVFIPAKNSYYAFDVAPGFWDWLEHVEASGKACSIDAVHRELLAGQDEISDWARSHKGFFVSPDQRTISWFQPLIQWAHQQHFTPAALNAFTASNADFLLVAHAAAYGLTVVTHEVADSGSRKRVKIPDACNAMGVSWCDTFVMMRSCDAHSPSLLSEEALLARCQSTMAFHVEHVDDSLVDMLIDDYGGTVSTDHTGQELVTFLGMGPSPDSAAQAMITALQSHRLCIIRLSPTWSPAPRSRPA